MQIKVENQEIVSLQTLIAFEPTLRYEILISNNICLAIKINMKIPLIITVHE